MTEETKAARLVENGKPVSTTATVEFPVEYDGKVYDVFTIKRPTVAEVSKFIRELADGRNAVPPMLVDVPLEVWLALDDDDAMALQDAMDPFMPRRLRTIFQSALEAGETT